MKFFVLCLFLLLTLASCNTHTLEEKMDKMIEQLSILNDNLSNRSQTKDIERIYSTLVNSLQHQEEILAKWDSRAEVSLETFSDTLEEFLDPSNNFWMACFRFKLQFFDFLNSIINFLSHFGKHMCHEWTKGRTPDTDSFGGQTLDFTLKQMCPTFYPQEEQ